MSDAPAALHALHTVVGASGDLRPLLDDPRVGAVAVDDAALPDLGPGATDVPLTVVATGGAAQLEGPLRLAARDGLRLASVRTTVRDAADPAGNVRRVAAAVDGLRSAGLLPEEVAVVLVLPPDVAPHAAQSALDEMSYADLVAGLNATDPLAWTALVDAALDREVPFEVVGARWDPAAALAAARACLDGDPAAGVLAGGAAAALAAYDDETLGRTRRWCTRVDVAVG